MISYLVNVDKSCNLAQINLSLTSNLYRKYFFDATTSTEKSTSEIDTKAILPNDTHITHLMISKHSVQKFRYSLYGQYQDSVQPCLKRVFRDLTWRQQLKDWGRFLWTLPTLAGLQWGSVDRVWSVITPSITWFSPGPRPLTVFRSNSKFDQNVECSSLKYAQPITTKFCTSHESYTVVTCAKYHCD